MYDADSATFPALSDVMNLTRLSVPLSARGTAKAVEISTEVAPATPLVKTTLVDGSIVQLSPLSVEYFTQDELYIAAISSAVSALFHIPTSSIIPLKYPPLAYLAI